MHLGRVISIEGISCTGKTTLIERIQARLHDDGVLTRIKTDLFDYTGESVGQKIKAILDTAAPTYRMGLPVVETLLILAKRAFESQQSLEVALRGGATVLCDRDIDTVCAYQLQVLRGHRPTHDDDALISWLRTTNAIACVEPALTFYLEVSPDVSYRRAVAAYRKSVERGKASYISDQATLLHEFEIVFSKPMAGRRLVRVDTEHASLADVEATVYAEITRND